jgi:tetratricopeptide (TPR) repeat protein
MTPFNIGRGIELSDFTRDEATVLAAGLSPYRETALGLLDNILTWTGGHPYLTQRLCAEVAKAGIHNSSEIDEVCAKLFLSPDAQNRDENLQFVRERILRGGVDPAAVLDSYARICRKEKVAREEHNPVHDELRLSGIVRVVDGYLQPRNRIYSRVFDLKWVRANLPEPEAMRQRAAFRRGVRRVVGSAAAALLVIGGFAVQAKRNADIAKHNADAARSASRQAEKEAQRAQQAALREKQAMDREKQAATNAKAAAEAAQQAAERERKANEERLAQAAQTKRTLDQLAALQQQVARLLSEITPLVGPTTGRDFLKLAEGVVKGLTSTSGNDPRILIALSDFNRACGRLYLRLGDEAKALEKAEAAQQLVRGELDPQTNSPVAAGEVKRSLFESKLLFGDVLLGGKRDDNAPRPAPAGYEQAMKNYEEAMQLAREEMQAHPQDAAWRERYYSSLMNLADTARVFSHPDEAQRRYSEALKELQNQRGKEPEAKELARIEAALHDRLGTLYLNKDKLDKAREEFDLGLQLREAESGDAAREDPERASDLAQSFNKLGNLALTSGDLKSALAYYQRSLAIRRRLCESNPRLDWSRNLGFSLANVAQVLWRQNQSALALQHYTERLKLAEQLLSRDHEDANLRADYANALLGRADVLLNASEANVRNWPEALEIARFAVARTERRDPRLLSLLSQALRLNGFPAEALSTAQEAAKLLPPPEKRTNADKDTANEIAFELEKSKVAARSAPLKPKRR